MLEIKVVRAFHFIRRVRIAIAFFTATVFVMTTVLPSQQAREQKIQKPSLAALPTLTVTKLTDTNDGVCNADCSLREAIATAVSGDTINFSVTGTVGLSLGELLINKNLTIQGPGPSLLSVARISGVSRIFKISPGFTVTIEGITVTGGNETGVSFHGGGILNDNGNLTVNNCIVTNNFSINGAGGGITNFGTLTVTDSIISNNRTEGGGGGGIINWGGGGGGVLIVRDSTISGNMGNRGGGIRNLGGAATIINSTISGNTNLAFGDGDGGGIYHSSATGTTTIINSTISGNTGNAGGGISVNLGGTVNLTNSTITGNTPRFGSGGGISLVPDFPNNSIVNLRNTIIAGNNGQTPDFGGTLTSQGYNLIGNTTGTTISGGTNDNLNVNPMLGPLANNGGKTWTHALLPASPAIDKGSAVTGMTTDQRGLLRPVDYPAITNAPGGNGSDIGAVEIARKTTPFDFDGDNKTDISIFRPSVGEWWYLKSSTGGNFAATFGTSSDKITPADFTGDGKTDFAFFRPSLGQWFVLRSEDLSFYAFPFGMMGDTPVPADYDGDGRADAAVFRESTLTWFINKSSGGTDIIGFGSAGDKPVVSDYDGDGKADIAIFRPNGTNGAEWWIRRSSNGTVFALQFGTSTDKPVPGDFTGDGKADIAFWRPSNGNWFVLRSEDFSFYAFPFGTTGDVPVAGDYDGDGKFDAGVFRPSSNTWFVQRSTAGTLIQTFGTAGDLPVPNVFVP